MCGIAGFVGRSGNTARETLDAMLNAIAHRGPDDRGAWLRDDLALGHLRLSIIDLSRRGHQPFVTSDGSGVISYNGEVYNFRELRRELEQEGATFVSRTDTEVVLEALHRWGPERAVARLNGMFAFAYYDGRNRSLWLARDRLGIKPLYIARRDDCLAFASEQKALFAHPRMACTLDVQALVELLLFERFDGTMTPYQGVEALAPGTLLRVQGGKESTFTYFDLLRDVDPARILANERLPHERFGERLAGHLENSVRMQLVSDAPLATLCSGGLDSGLVTALARDVDRDVVGYVADIEGMRGEERRRAQLVATRLGIELRPVSVSAEAYFRRLPAALLANDQPLFFSQDVATLLVAEAIQADGFKVVLSGDGADEIFGGYDWYAQAHRVWRRRRLHARWVRSSGFLRRLGRLHPFFRPLDLDRLARDPFGAGRGGTGEVSRLGATLVDGARRQLRAARLFRKLAPLPRHEDRAFLARGFEDVHVHMRERLGTLDRMTMACSLEARVPFLENRLVDFGLHLPVREKYHRGVTKRLIKELAARRLPEELGRLPKIGFQLHPSMFRGIGDLLKGGRLAELLKWKPDDQEDIVRLTAAIPFYQFRLVAIESWLRMRFHGESPQTVSDDLWRLHSAAAPRRAP